MQVLLQILGITALLYVMYRSAGFLVSSAASIAKRFNVSDLVIGLTIVAIGTSAPEFIVSLSSALKGSGDLSVANIVGSNIYNLGIILGVVALLSYIKITRHILYRDCLFLVAISFFQFFAFRDGIATRLEGLTVIGIFAVWMFLVFRHKEEIQEEVEEELPEMDPKHLWKNIGIFVVSLVALLAAGHFMVDLAVGLARSLGVSEWLIGLTIIGVGTSTPELITSIVAIRKNYHGMSIGNLFGSDIFNQGIILGVVSLISPLTTQGNTASSGFLFIALYVLALIVLMRRKWKLARFEGIIIITIIALRFGFEIYKGM